MHTFESVKRVCEEKDVRDGGFLAWLRPTGRVVLCYWLVGVALLKNKGHALLSM
jgi:hypothetical protein